MSPRINCCVICGYIIRDYRTLEEKWLAEFRVVYSNPEGCFVSGVGINRDPNEPLQASSDPTKRYDDENYDPHLTKDFYPSFCWEETTAFVSHNACWKLFEEASNPDDLPLKRFIEICSSLPLRGIMGLFHWGHTYGGIYSFDKAHSFPWEYRFEDEPLDPETAQLAREDPYNILPLTELIARTAHKPLIPETPVPTKCNDCFGRLPWEIREAIANQLHTQDALALRESSRSFQPLLTSSTFWASRFQPGLDRGFLFETSQRLKIRDWLSLYRNTSQKRGFSGLNNRIRIWTLIDYILTLLALRLADDESCLCKFPTHQPGLIEVNGRLMELVHSQFGGSNVLHDGCRLLKTQHAYIPQNLHSVALSFLTVGDHGHLTGIRFNSKDGTGVQLGYPFFKGTLVYKVEDLSGFVLAVDPKGIRAVQIVHKTEDRSAWFGFPEMVPVTERLSVIDIAKPIRVSVDGYKIIGIAANRLDKISDQSTLRDTSSSLRTTALWYPSVPSQNICLNEQNLRETTDLTKTYLPLHWAYFGGPQGAYLPHFTDLSLSYAINPISMEFHYTEESRISKTQFGRIGLVSLDYTCNPIDGPGGEMIESVQVAMRHGGICALKLITSNGEVFDNGTTAPPRPYPPFPGAPMPDPEPEAEFETLMVAPNTTITGFYASHDGAQFPNLGITSETIH